MKEIELYVHIPFCVRKCNYCDFLSAPCDVETKERYVNALCKEILSSGSLLQEYEVTTIFFGGGTPSLLSAEQISSVMKAIRNVAILREECEITIECNPGTIHQELLTIYQELGINRLSFGLQSTDNEELRELGRIHTYEQFVENYELARNCGFTNINVDLMSALPKQTLASYEETLNKVIALQPEHISSYSLIIEEGTKFWAFYGDEGTRLKDLPSVELDRSMYEKSKLILEDAGYFRYEISNYAKPSYECRHNIGYWKRTEYLGFGLGASSLYQNQRFTNTSELRDYIDKITENQNCWCDIQSLSVKEAMEEFMFLGLRLCEGVSKHQFFDQFQRNLDEIYGEVLDKLRKENLIMEDGDKIKLTDYGVDVSNVVLAEFLLE
jgi:oxygen-independent coproporphyrinogen-3 oxidase